VKAFAAVLLLFLACPGEDARKTPPPAPPAAAAPAAPAKQTDIAAEDYEMPPLPMGRVTLTDAFGGKHVVEVEIAATHDARTRGLMWRRELADGKGMLFIFKQQQPLTFWMKNTLIPLDMLFIDADLKIVGVVENAEPKTFTSRGVPGPSMFVLEVPAGWWAKKGLKAGSAIAIDGAADLKVEP
jgi:uncharacterized protein